VAPCVCVRVCVCVCVCVAHNVPYRTMVKGDSLTPKPEE
jgi:hypothetical protein